MIERTKQEPRAYTFDSIEDAETQAEWEAAQRVRRLMDTPSPWAPPDDRL